MKRRFNARISHDKGLKWTKVRATGWPVTELKAQTVEDTHGYVLAVDKGDMMVDIELPERILKLILKDIGKKKFFDDNGGEDEHE